VADELEVQEEAEEGAPEWVVTFGDMMSLLLTFFILLLSFSELDVAKYKELAGSLEQAFGVQRKDPTATGQPKGMKFIFRDFDQAFVEQAVVGENEYSAKDMVEKLNEQLEAFGIKELKEQGLFEIEAKENQITLRLMGQSTFDSGSAVIKPEMIPILQEIGKIISPLQEDILVAGHTDNVPLKGGIYQSNLDLSAARAASVMKFFVSHGLVIPEKIATMAFGEYRPLVPNTTAENRQKNRRVEIILTLSDAKKTTAAETKEGAKNLLPIIKPSFFR
jgi:chemotaxis protein MotB